MANVIPNAYKLAAGSGSIAWLTDTIKVALLDSSFVPNGDTQKFFSDVSAHEITGTNYTAGGVTLASKTAVEDDTNDRGVFGAANPAWTNLTATGFAFAVVYKSTGTSSTSPIIAIIDLGGSQTQTGANLTLQVDSAGVFYLG